MRFILTAVFTASVLVVAVQSLAKTSTPTASHPSFCETYEPDCDRL